MICLSSLASFLIVALLAGGALITARTALPTPRHESPAASAAFAPDGSVLRHRAAPHCPQQPPSARATAVPDRSTADAGVFAAHA